MPFIVNLNNVKITPTRYPVLLFNTIMYKQFLTIQILVVSVQMVRILQNFERPGEHPGNSRRIARQ